MTEQSIETQVPAPAPTTKPAGTSFSTFAMIAAVVSLFIGGFILSAAALGLAIRGKMLDQKRSVLAICLAAGALVLNIGFAAFLA